MFRGPRVTRNVGQLQAESRLPHAPGAVSESGDGARKLCGQRNGSGIGVGDDRDPLNNRYACFPRGWGPASLGSHTDTVTCWSAFGSSAPAMSKANGSYPPRWRPIWSPFTYAVASQSTASKRSQMCWPAQPDGRGNAR